MYPESLVNWYSTRLKLKLRIIARNGCAYVIEIDLSGSVCVLTVVTRCEDIHHTLAQIQALQKC